jgi:hypothetical protein
MRKTILFLFILLPVFVFSQTDECRVRSFQQGKIDRWDVSIGQEEGWMEAYMKDDPNRWTFEIGSLTGEVNTEYHDQYNCWLITVNSKTYKLKTWTSRSWQRWELTGGDIKDTITIRTLYDDAWANWEMKHDSTSTEITTYYNDSWNDWTVKAELSKLTEGEKIAACFIPLFVSRVWKKGLVR